MTTTTTERPPPDLRDVGAFVHKQVSGLQARALSDRRDSAAVASLARLRRGVGRPPGTQLDILDLTHHDAFARGDDPGPEEWAVHVAMTQWALHQQSKGRPMHRRGRGLGAALRSLHSGGSELPDPLLRRFRMLGTAGSFEELLHHLRGTAQLLRAADVSLDYGVLADQLVDWHRPDRRHRVLRRWGSEFYRTRRTDAASDQH